MKAWEFAKALNLQKANGWTRFISMQHNYSLVAREEEREMIPLCADEGVATLIYSPLARGKLARAWGTSTTRTETEPAVAEQKLATADSDRAIVGAVNAIAAERGVSAAQIPLAWLRRNPVVAAPIVGVLKACR
jgi:1-deoxyxylulose-5-phosphate synthase